MSQQELSERSGVNLRTLQNYQQTLSSFVGPTEIFISGDTLQLKDYSKTDMGVQTFCDIGFL
ncbi:MAG: hypothetical protein J6D53_04610 [Blautia sp.]|nr:hypothetical protein [Lachnospiraceae bacterium]MBP3900730.1 hypothetical protein [Blautia sp.]